VATHRQAEAATPLRLRRVLVPHDRHPGRPTRGARAVWVWSVLLVLVALAVAVVLRAGVPWARLSEQLGRL
jgi:hypothetical protein